MTEASKKSRSVLWYLPISIVVLLITAWTFHDFYSEDLKGWVIAPTYQTEVPAQNTDSGKPTEEFISDVAVYSEVINKVKLIGKKANFTDLHVVRIVGPRTFAVEAGDEELLILLDSSAEQDTGTQGEIAIGKRVTLTGVFELFDESEVDASADNRFRKLSNRERALLGKKMIYLHADRISKIN